VDALCTTAISTADCHLYRSVNLLTQQHLFPFNSSLMFPIANPATFVPDRNKILTRGTVTARPIFPASTNFEKNLIIYICVSPCKTADCQLFYTNRDVTSIKITSSVTNDILKMFLRKYLISRTQMTADICKVQGGSNMTGTDLYVNKPHCAAAVRP